jgi:hypothetical protein
MGLDFWWIDADISVVKDIRKLSVRGDMNFEIDGPQRTTVRDGQLHVEGAGWAQACAGFMYVKQNERTLNAFTAMQNIMIHIPTLDDQQALNEVISNRRFFTIGAPKSSAPNLLSIDYFSQDDVWSAHMVWAGYPLNSTAVHINGQSYDNKVLLLKAMRFWHLDDKDKCLFRRRGESVVIERAVPL